MLYIVGMVKSRRVRTSSKKRGKKVSKKASKKTNVFTVAVCVLALVLIGSALGLWDDDSADLEVSPIIPDSGEMIVHYIDVGQGDATLLQGPDFNILIDTGRHDRDEVVPYLEAAGVESLDLLVGTHPHADHIGQMDKVLQSFEVKEVWMSGEEASSQTFGRILDAILASEASYAEPRAGENYQIGSLGIEVIHPEQLIGDLNEGSISMRMTYGQVSFLFTGDAEHRAEQSMLERNHNLSAHIFHLGHHGSSTSNTLEFVERVNPELAIYSAAMDSPYGHPHDEVVALMQELEIPMYGTAVHGHIIVTTDGTTYAIETQKE